MLPKALSFPDVDEEEKTTIESGWEEEPSTTVEQGEIADKLRGLGVEQPRNRSITNVTSTNAGGLDEATVEDQHANVMSIVTPVAAPTRILITQGNETGAELEIRPGKIYTIGRGVDNDVVLTDIAVSRKHFDLRHEAGSWLVIDRGSGNGTLVNGNLEDQPFILANGDAIEIGNTTFRFEQANGQSRATAGMEARSLQPQHDRDDDEEPSTVAGKPMRSEEPYQPAPRAKTLPPPTPLRSRSPSVAPAPMPPAPMPPAPMPPPQYAVPSIATRPPRPATLLGQDPQLQPLANVMPTTLPGQGIPMAPSMLNSQPQMQGYGYGHDMPPPYLVHNARSSREAPATALVQPTPFTGVAAAAPFVAQPVPALSRRTKMILGSIGLTAFAAIVTVAVMRSGGAPAVAPPDDKPVVSAKPTIEAIQPPTITPALKDVVVEPPRKPEPPKATVVKADPPAPPTPPTPTIAPPTPKVVKNDPPPPAPKKVEPPPRVVKSEPPPKKEPPPRVVKNEPPPKKEPPPKRVASAEPPTPRAATDSSGAKSKAAQQFAAKQFSPAIATLKSAAQTASPEDKKELEQQARIYDQFARNYNVGTAPGTAATEAFVALIKARNFDNGGAFRSEIEGKLASVAQSAAVTFTSKGQFVEAFNAVRTSEGLSGANSTTKAVRAKLESQAADLYNAAAKDMPAESAKEKLQTVLKIVESKSQWYQKASKLLAST